MVHKYFDIAGFFQFISLFYIVLTSSGCVLDEPDLKDLDLGIEDLTQCGLADRQNMSDGLSIQYGFGRPFMPSMFSGTQNDPLDLPMEYGLQGGHHVDISLRFTGELNPDLVNINIHLSISPPFNDVYYGIHNTQGWYLLFPQDNEEVGCYFHQARIFLFDLEGSPVEPLDVAMLHGLSTQLYIKLTTETADHEWMAIGNLRNAVNDQ